MFLSVRVRVRVRVKQGFYFNQIIQIHNAVGLWECTFPIKKKYYLLKAI